MSDEPGDDAPEGQWIVYDEIGSPIARCGQDEKYASEVARSCGGADKGIHAIYKEIEE